MASQLPVGHGLFTIETSRSHSQNITEYIVRMRVV